MADFLMMYKKEEKVLKVFDIGRCHGLSGCRGLRRSYLSFVPFCGF